MVVGFGMERSGVTLFVIISYVVLQRVPLIGGESISLS